MGGNIQVVRNLRTPAHKLPELVRQQRPQLVLIDGPSGSGKTSLANQLAPLGYTVLHMDSWYPGWDGLAAGSQIAEQIATGELDAYPKWDWEEGRVERWVPVKPGGLVIEGCGALTRVSAPAADMRVWIHLDDDTAKSRGLQRDGEAFEPWWDMWREQELVHWEENAPWKLADVILDGSAGSFGTIVPKGRSR